MSELTGRQKTAIIIIALLCSMMIVGMVTGIVDAPLVRDFLKIAYSITADVLNMTIDQRIQGYIDLGLGGSPWQTEKQSQLLVNSLSVSGTTYYYVINGTTGRLHDSDTSASTLIQVANDAIKSTYGTIYLKGDYSIDAPVNVSYRVTLLFEWGSKCTPASDIDMFWVYPGGSIQGILAETFGLGDGGFTSTVITLNGSDPDGYVWWRDCAYTRMRDITIYGRRRSIYGNETMAGTGIKLQATDTGDSVGGILFENIWIVGQYNISLHLYAINTAGGSYAYVNSNEFNNIHLKGSYYLLCIEEGNAGANAQTAGNLFTGTTFHVSNRVECAIYSFQGSGNRISGWIMDNHAINGSYVIDFQGTGDYFIGGSSTDFIASGEVNDPNNRNTVILTRWRTEHKPDWVGFSVIRFQSDAAQTAGTERWMGMAHDSSSATVASFPIGVDSTIGSLICDSTGAAGAGESYTYTVLINGQATGITCVTSGDTDTQSTDTTHTVAVSEDDFVCISIVSTGGAAVKYHSATLQATQP